MAISRMDMERQMRNMGGIMGLEDQRQGYFLGKLVKKVKKGVKKVVKSPLGKLALGAAALKFGGPGLAKLLGRPATGFLSGQFTGQGGIFNAARGLFDQGNLLAGLVRDPETGKFSLGRAALSGLGAASIAAPFFMGGDDEEVDEGTPFTDPQADIEDIRSQAKAYYSDPTQSALYFMPPKGAVQSSFYADGGLASLRPGYAGGQLVGPSGDGSRPGYAGESDIGILDVIKSLPSAVGQIFSGETESMLGDNQEEKNKFMIQDMFPDIDKETLSMIVDMKNRGAGVDEISTITGQDPSTITNMLSILNMKAYGGRIGYRIGGGVLQKAGQMFKAGVGKVKSLFDDADISVQIRDEDVATDAGLQAQAVGQDVFITPKSKKAVQVIDGLIDEGYDITKDADGDYAINALDEGALDLITQRLRIGSKGADEFIDAQDYYYKGDTGMMDEESKMIYDALRNRKADGGIMDLGGLEKDYREGGFVPLGAEERADDVPARLSKNEFVFTADAVRNAGQGDIDRGAEVMQNMMDNLESGGTISEESQGLENPAQSMFDQAQQLESRIE
jgi:hypothetical protein